MIILEQELQQCIQRSCSQIYNNLITEQNNSPTSLFTFQSNFLSPHTLISLYYSAEGEWLPDSSYTPR